MPWYEIEFVEECAKGQEKRARMQLNAPCQSLARRTFSNEHPGRQIIKIEPLNARRSDIEISRARIVDWFWQRHRYQ